MLIVVGLTAVVLRAYPATSEQTPVTIRASVGSAGQQADGASTSPSLSGDGRFVAFTSTAPNLVPGDTNGLGDVFVKDALTGSVARVSVSSAGVQGHGESFAPAISADGRFVAFASDAGNLVQDDGNEDRDVFVHDGETGSTIRASVGPLGEESDGGSSGAALSSSGRFVAFTSHARNLAPGDENRASDVFVKDLLTGALECISVGPSGEPADGGSESASISADGLFVAFASTAANLVGEPPIQRVWHVYVRDRLSGTTLRASVATDGSQADGHSFAPAISADGRYVAFTGRAKNLVPGDTNDASDVFVRDLQACTTARVSVSTGGDQAGADCSNPSITGDGRFVVFCSEAVNLVAGDANGVQDIFLQDRVTGSTSRVSAGPWSMTSGASHRPSISTDGRYVAFPDASPDLVPGDTNGKTDVFVRGPIL